MYTRLTCEERRCEAEAVWWAAGCSCHRAGDTRVRAGAGLQGAGQQFPCQEAEQLVVSPYGDGVCSYTPDDVRYQQCEQ